MLMLTKWIIMRVFNIIYVGPITHHLTHCQSINGYRRCRLTLLRRRSWTLPLKPHSHRIVRFLYRTIGCDLANVRPIGNVYYDLQKRLVAYCDPSYDWSYAWSRDQHRLEKIDGKIHRIVGNRTTSRSHKRSWPPTIDRTISRGILRPIASGVVWGVT